MCSTHTKTQDKCGYSKKNVKYLMSLSKEYVILGWAMVSILTATECESCKHCWFVWLREMALTFLKVPFKVICFCAVDLFFSSKECNQICICPFIRTSSCSKSFE